MKKVWWYGALIIVIFAGGYYSHRPKAIIKEIKVYDFAQEPDKMQLYANTMGKVLVDKDEFEKKVKEADERIKKDRDEFNQKASQREIEFQQKIYQEKTDLRLRQHEYWEAGYMEGLRKKLQLRLR